MLPEWTYEEVIAALDALIPTGKSLSPALLNRRQSLALLTMLINRRYPTGKLRRSSLLSIFDRAIEGLFANIAEKPDAEFTFFSNSTGTLPAAKPNQRVVIDARGFAPEGENSLALAIVKLVEAGFRHLIVAHARGHRFIGNGLSSRGSGVKVEVYGSSGDYLASGIDGMEIIVHGNGQDQLSQIMKSGKLVIHGDVGQTFMYAAKGGEAYILGNAAGRPLINAVGKPRVVINGTCLDYLAESFMAGEPLNGGGFVILNGIKIDDDGQLHPLETPYPGGNLFSLASGGALYIRDPKQKVTGDQLNGGEFAPLTPADWDLILPYLQENERLFNIPINLLLEENGEPRQPEAVYRKIIPTSVRSLQAEEAWVGKHS
jgi:glutamate synthase domain-containing protein 3